MTLETITSLWLERTGGLAATDLAAVQPNASHCGGNSHALLGQGPQIQALRECKLQTIA